MSLFDSSARGLLGSSAYHAGLRDTDRFPSPWLDMASTQMPEDLSNALQWSEFIMMSNATYRQAMERIVSYFNTDLEIGAAGEELSDDEKDKWKDLCDNQMHILSHIRDADMNKMTYGNDFLSIIVPFRRFLVCPRCHSSWLLREVYSHSIFNFRFSNFEFYGTCPKCNTGSGWRGQWRVHDEPDTRPEALKLRHWSPHEIQILHDLTTDDCDYLWKIPEDYKQQIRRGALFHLERVDKQVLKAIKHNQLFQFAKGAIYHMKEPTLAGIRNRGWGISRIIANFRQIWYVQVLHRYNEAIALDYVIPFRLVTPAPRNGAAAGDGDILLNANMGSEMAQLRRMIRMRRRDPAMWHTLGFPVEYKVLGGDATQLAPSDLLTQGIDTMLNASGTPVELYRNTLQMQVAPVALRLFEATWHHLVHGNNMFLRWFVERISMLLSWEAVQIRHRRVTHADDMQKYMAILQMAMGGSVSMTTALRALGLEFKDEMRNLLEEARYSQEQQSAVQEEMDQAAFGQQVAKGQMPGAPAGAQGGGAAGEAAGPVDPNTGQPAAGMGMGPVTGLVQNDALPQSLEDMESTAESLAQQLLGLPESQKRSELSALKKKNETLHRLVRGKMDEIRTQARSQGGQMLMSQQFGG